MFKLMQSIKKAIIIQHPFQTSGKLVATVDSKANSIFVPEIIKDSWNGLALYACESTALQIGPLRLGHGGVAVWNNDGTWTVGAVQGAGPNAWHVSEGAYNGGWDATVGTFLDVERYLAGDLRTQRPNVNLDYPIQMIRPNQIPSSMTMVLVYTTKLKSSKLKDPEAEAANDLMDKFWSRGYTLKINDCNVAATETLIAYGALSNRIGFSVPNWNYAIMPGVEYYWNKDLKAYLPTSTTLPPVG